MRMALTGHRPERLGYPDLCFETTSEWRKIINWLKEKMLELGITDAYCGMASGCDIAYGIAVIELNNEALVHKINRPDIKLHCILPCKNYNSSNTIWYRVLRDEACEWVELADEFYKGCDNVRDQYMVDHSDMIFAIWDGNKTGGVWSTIRKAEKKGIDVIYYPKDKL